MTPNPIRNADHSGQDQAEKKKKKLLIIDAYAIVYRAHYAIPANMSTSAGELTNATYGFSMMLMTLLERERPDYVVLAFEGGGLTFRHTLFESYKANRSEMPAQLRAQLSRIRQVAGALGIAIYQLGGYEADDVIATLARQAGLQNLEVVIASGDRDLLQLVTKTTTVVMPGQKFGDPVYMTPAAVKTKYGIDPAFFAGYKALVGDKSDNIDGIPGIGPVTACKLLNRYGTLENVMFHLVDVEPEKVQKVLSDHFKLVERNLKLVKLVSNLDARSADITLDLDFCKFGQFSELAAINLFRELEFKQLFSRLNTLLKAKSQGVYNDVSRRLDSIDEGKPEPTVLLIPQPQQYEPKATSSGQLMMF